MTLPPCSDHIHTLFKDAITLTCLSDANDYSTAMKMSDERLKQILHFCDGNPICIEHIAKYISLRELTLEEAANLLM